MKSLCEMEAIDFGAKTKTQKTFALRLLIVGEKRIFSR